MLFRSILSSGHFRNEHGRIDAGLATALRRTPDAVLIMTRGPEREFPALARVEPFLISGRTFAIVGGVALDEAFLARLARDRAIGVSLDYPGGRLSTGPARLNSADDFAVGELHVPLIRGGDDPTQTLQARLEVTQPLTPLKTLLRGTDSWLFTTAAGAALLALLLAVWVSSRVSGRLAALAEKTAVLDLDRLDVEFDPGTDEVGRLSRLLSDLAGRLRTSTARVREAERRATVGDLARQINHDIKNGLIPLRNVMAEPPQVVEPDQVPPREYIFVLDVSGSMHGFPLDTAKKLMGDLANVLRPSDAFNIVVFADGSDTFSRASVPATPANLTRGLQFIGRRNGGGGTRLLAALERAVAIERQPGVSRSIVLVTDGYIEAESDVFDYVRAQRGDVNFFAFGIGSSVNRLLIEGVAKAGLGEPFIVTAANEAAEAAVRLRRYIDTPVLTGIDVKFTGFDAYDIEPGAIPDLFASRPIVVFGKWRGKLAGSIQISGKTGRGEYQTSVPVSASSAHMSHAALRQLWARNRIGVLSDFGPGNPSEKRVAEITSLGLSYSLLTRYTSFVAVQEIVRTAEGADDVDQPLPMPAGVSDLAVGVTAGPEPDILWVGSIVVALLGCGSLVRMRRRRTGVSL